MFEALGLTDYQNVLEVDLLSVWWRRRYVVWRLLRFHLAGLNQKLRIEKGERKKEEDPKSAHAVSLQT